jgi:hypothetical protein
MDFLTLLVLAIQIVKVIARMGDDNTGMHSGGWSALKRASRPR